MLTQWGPRIVAGGFQKLTPSFPPSLLPPVCGMYVYLYGNVCSPTTPGPLVVGLPNLTSLLSMALELSLGGLSLGQRSPK